MAFCTYCGNEVAETAISCPKCGHPRTGPAPARPAPKTEGLAVASLALGIAGLVACPLVASIIAIVLGGQARAKIRQDPTLEGEGMARTGIILGWVGVGLTALVIVGGLLLVMLVGPGPSGMEDFNIDAIGVIR